MVVKFASKELQNTPSMGNPATIETFQQAALDLFSERNYSAVTIKDIASATGMTASLLYYYFVSKDRLFLTVLEATIKKVFSLSDDIFSSDLGPKETLGSWFQNHIDNYELIQKLIKIMLDYSGTHSRSRDIDNAITRFYDIEAEFLQSAIKRGIKSGLFRRVNPNEISDMIATFLDGVLVRPVIRPGFQPKVAIRQFHTFLVEFLSPTDGRDKTNSLRLQSKKEKRPKLAPATGTGNSRRPRDAAQSRKKG